MKPVAFEDLVHLPILRHYEEAFHKATGVTLSLAPPHAAQCICPGTGDKTFCAMVCNIPAGCKICGETQGRVRKASATRRIAQHVHCFAGLTEIAVPVLIDGRHVATLMSGQVFRRKPTKRDFETVLKLLGGKPGREWEKNARKAYFDTLVVPVERLRAVIQLITVFATHLGDDASRHSIARSDGEPAAVGSAKEYVQSHAEHAITLKQVLEHVNAGRFHFCKLFKKTTGMTLTEYVSRVRVAKAKALLADPDLRITEVVFAAGFGSVPQFNNVFKRFVGMPPTAYRLTLRTRPRIEPSRA